MSSNLNTLAAEFNRYFTSSNGVDVPAKVSVSRDEWRQLFTAIQQAQGEPFGYIHHFVAHDESGALIDTTWEADGCADALPHPTYPDSWKWSHSTPFYTNPAPGVPEFIRIAKRKLDELQEQGFAITGYAIQRGPVRGFIDASGFVGWRQCEPDPGLPDDVARDAERYRWLRDRDHWPAPFASSQDPEPVRGTDLDAAIDAAMLAASPAQKGGE